VRDYSAQELAIAAVEYLRSGTLRKSALTDGSPLYAILYAEGANFRYHGITPEKEDWRFISENEREMIRDNMRKLA
jgi:hypothetical protein